MRKLWLKEDGSFKALSSEQVEGLNAAEMGDYLKAQNASNKGEIVEMIETKNESNVVAINKLRDENEANNTKMFDILKQQGEAMANIRVTHKATGVVKTVKDALIEKSEQIKDVKNRAFEIQVKAKHNPTDIGDREDLAQLIDGVEDLARRATFVRDFFRTVPSNTEFLRKTEQDVVVRDAKNVAACAPSTHTTKLTWKMTTLQQKKVRDFTHICIDMLEDYDFVEGEIRDLIEYGVRSQVDSQLLLGDGLGDNLNGIASYASTFTAALVGADYSAAIDLANIGDLICVAGAQIEFLGQDNKFMPNVAFLNPKRIKLLKLQKDVNGMYLLPNWLTANGDEVGSIRLIGNPLVPENEAYVMDSTKGVIYSRKALSVGMSFENNDNFETECVTVKGYERLNLWVSTNNANAFMHIADVDAAIVAITK